MNSKTIIKIAVAVGAVILKAVANKKGDEAIDKMAEKITNKYC